MKKKVSKFDYFSEFNGKSIELTIILIISRVWMQKSIEKPLKISILLKTFRDPSIPGNENKISHKKHFPEKAFALLYSNDSLLKFLIIIVDVSNFF